MYLFKYYRPDFYFEKAIRYNELYFSSPAQLNDPNDLNLKYRFDNKLNLWKLLLRLECSYSHKDLSQILNLGKKGIYQGLNKIFKSKRITNNLEELDNIFETHKADIQKILYDNMLPINEIESKIYENEAEAEKFLVNLCEQSIKERLYRKIIPAVCSVSFSSKALDSMMWAHYAAGFGGCVVIYKTTHSDFYNLPSMKLKDNIFSKLFIDLTIKPIQYNNKIKEVSLLGYDHNAFELFFIKNRFWRYESEYRMFISEMNSGIENERNIRNYVNRNSGHIFYHEANAIKGIIFGPKMSFLKKEEIWQIVKSNMENTDLELCYFFDTQLSSSGKIKISMGHKAEKYQGYGLSKEPMSKTELSDVLRELEVTH